MLAFAPFSRNTRSKTSRKHKNNTKTTHSSFHLNSHNSLFFIVGMRKANKNRTNNSLSHRETRDICSSDSEDSSLSDSSSSEPSVARSTRSRGLDRDDEKKPFYQDIENNGVQQSSVVHFLLPPTALRNKLIVPPSTGASRKTNNQQTVNFFFSKKLYYLSITNYKSSKCHNNTIQPCPQPT